MSAYAGDPRVVVHHEDSITAGGWTVRCTAGRWTAYHEEHGFLRDAYDGGYFAERDTADEILAQLLGPPRVAA